MKKRILSVLLTVSMIIGIISVNAVSITFKEISEEQKINESNIYFEEIETKFEEIDDEIETPIIENENINSEEIINSPKVTNSENFKNLFTTYDTFDSTEPVTNNAMNCYFVEATNISYYGQNSVVSETLGGLWGESATYLDYTNTSIDSSKYVIYENTVQAGDKTYDLVIYPFRCNRNAQLFINIKSFGKVPAFRVNAIGYNGYKLVITEHNNINKTIGMDVMFGMADLDNTEYFIVPSDFSEFYMGNGVQKSQISSPVLGIRYIGITDADNIATSYNNNAVVGVMSIPKEGTIIYYGSTSGCYRATISFTEMKEYIENHAYQIQFNANGGLGVPSMILKYGENVSTVMGNIENTIPLKSGYTFKGWSASPDLNDKRVAYDIGNTGATKTSNSWTYADYCDYTGGNLANRNLVLYAQWEANKYPVTYIDKNSNGNELGRTTKQVDYNTNVRGADIGSDTADNAYYKQYRYVSDTSTTVTTSGVTVYRIFEFCKTEATSNLQWNDNNDSDGFRPDKYKLKLKQNGVIIDEVELSSDITNYTFSDLPKYDAEGIPYQYTFDVDATERYKINFDADGNLIIEDYQPANFTVTIPKKITLNGNTGKANYTVSVNGTFYYNDTLTIKPDSGFILTDRNNISSMQANVTQTKTTFKKENIPSSISGNISVNRIYFSGSWQGNFNFEIKFVMKN